MTTMPFKPLQIFTNLKMKKLFFPCLLFLVVACQTTKNEVTFTDAEGKIKVFVCSRGCFQYLLETGDKLYFPDAVPDSLKTDGQPVIFTGKLLPDKTIVNKPGADDTPVPDFEAQNIHIIKMVSK